MNSLEIRLHSPVCIARKRGVGNAIETLDYIPGSTIRGALAMCFLKQHGYYNQDNRRWEPIDQKQVLFNHLFLSDKVRFGNAYIEGCRVIPMTAFTCKYYKGFRGKDTHGVFDAVLAFAKYELTGELDDKLESCYKCQANMDRFGGYYKQAGETTFEKSEATKRIIARTAIAASHETALHGSFYTLDALNEKQLFSGEIRADAKAIEQLQKLIAQPNDHLRIGTAKTRALGEISVTIQEVSDYSTMSVKERLISLNNKAKFTSRSLFTVTLHSDAILLDEILRYKTVIELDDLREIISHNTQIDLSILDRFEPLRSWVSNYRVTGWNVATKHPKSDEIAMTKGSVFMFVSKEGQELDLDAIDNLAGAIEQIENIGIGERRNEGFGRIRVCDEFHWEVYAK